MKGLREIEGVHILADNIEKRLGNISFYIDGLHYNLVDKLLNDRFGIQPGAVAPVPAHTAISCWIQLRPFP
jgi:selenocysteine lyase/cysteine desulfurase